MPGAIRVRGPSAAPTDPSRPGEPGDVIRRFVEVLSRCEETLARRSAPARRRSRRATVGRASA